MSKCITIAVSNQKGGVGKTTTCGNLGIGLAQKGKRVLLIDNDPQGSLTASLDLDPDNIDITLNTILTKIIDDEKIEDGEGIIHHKEGIDILPSNIDLSGLELTMVNVLSREHILKQYISSIEDKYDYIIIDCSPSLGMLTVNALTAADKVIIPVNATYLSVRGLQQLMATIIKIKKTINSNLEIAGILLTLIDRRTNYTKAISQMVRDVYGSSVNVFETYIPFAIKAAESSYAGKSVYKYSPKGKVAQAYSTFVDELEEGIK